MDLETVMSKLIKPTYVQQSMEAIESRRKKIVQLFEKRKLPEDGWDDLNIELILAQLSLMDSNNFIHNLGIGERESRFLSDIVARRHFRLGHGIGRSGDLAEVQPKAAGSSLLSILTNSLVLG
jgi:UGA suppressor tRNA-associated protein, putative